MIKIKWAWVLAVLLTLSFDVTADSDTNVPQEEQNNSVPIVILPLSMTDPEDESEVIEVDAESAPEDNLVELAEPEEVNADSFVIYIVRHAEKEDTQLDPGLTTEGNRRAEGLAQMLSEAGVERIYSTIYRRNAATALPLARTLNLPVEFYQAAQGDALVTQLLAQRQTALVIGHSNTVADLINALGGTADELSEDRYGDVFQLLMQREGDELNVHQLHLTVPLLLVERRI